MAGFRPTPGLPPWKLLSSISAYYHTSAVPAFAGSLVALSLFLFSYRGYNNEYGRRDRAAAVIAGGAALLVAFFPAGVPGHMSALSWWTPPIGWIHYFSAALLFGSFVFFSLLQFPKSKLGKVNPFRFSGSRSEEWDLGKWVRNWIYISCGVAIVICMVWAVSASFAGTSLFWPETLALEFFAVSWLVKGRTDKTVNRAFSAIRGKRDWGPLAPKSSA